MKAVVDRSDDPVSLAAPVASAAPPSRRRFAAFAILFGLGSGIACHALLAGDAGWPVLLLMVSITSTFSSLAAMLVFRRIHLPLEAAVSVSAEQAQRLQAYETLSQPATEAAPADPAPMAAPDPAARMDAADAMVEARRQRDAVIAASRECLIIVDANGRIEIASAAAAALIDLAPADVAERALAPLFPLYDNSRPEPLGHPLKAALHNLFAEGAPPGLTLASLLERRGRTSVPLRLQAQPLRDAQHRVQSLLLRLDPSPVETISTVGEASPPAAPLDPLTASFDFQHLVQRIARLQDEARREGTRHALLLIALDRFEMLHDQFGVLGGEQRLWQLAQTIRAAAASADDVHRLSARHFALLLPRTADDVGRATALCAEVGAQVWGSFSPSISIGVVSLDGSEIAADALVARADDARLRALELGGGRAQRAFSEPTTPVLATASWLQSRLAASSLRLAAQPILPVTASPGAGEAPWLDLLVRIEDDDGVWLPIAPHLAALEHLGRSAQVDHWVLDTALRHSLGNTRLSISLSSASLLQDDFLLGLRDRLSRSAVPTAQLFIGVDERFLIEQPQRSAALQELLSPFGCSLMIDQYRGRDGFSALRASGARRVRLDESLVGRHSLDPIDRAHLESLVAVARAAGARTLASGIRDADTQERLRLARVDYVQGAAVAPPVPFSS